jgi:hypothetical protein
MEIRNDYVQELANILWTECNTRILMSRVTKGLFQRNMSITTSSIINRTIIVSVERKIKLDNKNNTLK